MGCGYHTGHQLGTGDSNFVVLHELAEFLFFRLVLGG